MCLECSGQHRSLGVHLSFVRSIQMDSWNERQIAAMEKSGGNQKLVEFFQARGIDKTVQIATKYNTKQAAYYKERLTRILDGKTEPPPDPGRWDPVTGVSEAQGAEPLPGETTEQYNARQAKLREAARERLRAKFGNSGGMGSVGSHPQPREEEDSGLGALAFGAVGAVGGILGGAVNLVQKHVIENEELHMRLQEGAGGLGQYVGDKWNDIRQSSRDGQLLDNFKKNITLQEGSTANNLTGWAAQTAGGIGGKIGNLGSGLGDLMSDGGSQPAPQAPRSPDGHPLRAEPNSGQRCSQCKAMGTRYSCSGGTNYHICTKCFEKPSTSRAGGKKGGFSSFDDDDWGNDEDFAPPPKEVTKEDMDKLAKEMGMKLSTDSSASPAKQGMQLGDASPSPTKTRNGGYGGVEAIKNMELSPAKPKEKAKSKTLEDPDDFFAEFGM